MCFKCQAKQPKRGSKTDSDVDTIPDVVEIANGLDPTKNDVALDLDKDGFANGEEIKLGTKPNDPASHPPLIGKLRVDQIGDRPLKFHLKEITKAGTAILLQVSIAGTDKLNAKVGETVNGWLVKSFNDATKTLDITKDGETLKLPRGKPVEKNRPVASLKSLADPSFKTVTVLPGGKGQGGWHGLRGPGNHRINRGAPHRRPGLAAHRCSQDVRTGSASPKGHAGTRCGRFPLIQTPCRARP